MSEAASEGRAPQGQGVGRIVEKVLIGAGLIGLIGLHEDLVRWSALANWFVERYRSVVEPVQNWLLSVLPFSPPAWAGDALVLGGVFFAAANVYSLRRHDGFAFLHALRILWWEQIVRRGPRDGRDYGGAFADWVGPAAANLAHICAAFLLYLALVHGPAEAARTGFLDVPRLWGAIGMTAMLSGYLLLSSLDQNVPEGEPDRFRSRAFRIFLVATLLLLPAALYRWASFFLFSLLLVLLSAWRWYLVLLLLFVAVLMLNEAYLRFAYDWPEGRPDCAVFSLPGTCAADPLAPPPPGP